MSDADLKRKWEQINDPVEALETLVEFWCFIGTDPYYRDLNDALWRMAERALTTKPKARIAELEQALRPFAEYGAYMKGRWTQHDDNAFYGVKRIDAPQIKIKDFRHAVKVLECSQSNATTREN